MRALEPEPELIDIGANLTHRRFREDLGAVLERARSVGVGQLLVTGLSESVAASASTLAAAHPGVLYSTAGIHPHNARTFHRDSCRRLAELAAAPHVLAIGECGLDFDRDFSPRPIQERCFEAQLELAASCGLPVFLHERAAHERFLAILTRFRQRLVGGVVHCFTGAARERDAYLDLDLHLGITGWICDDRRGMGLREVVAKIPSERLLIETDSPFLTPPTERRSGSAAGSESRRRATGGRNEPSFLPRVLAQVARSCAATETSVAEHTTANARRLFRLARPAEKAASRL